MRPLSCSLMFAVASFAAAATTNRFIFDPRTVRLDPRVELTLWAAEPDVVDPVAICWDGHGVAYVAECRDYPYGVGPDGRVGSTVRRLEDTDGDGRADKATVFARDLSYATSVTPWRGGVLVAGAPEIVFLKDTDGDGVADVREIVLSGLNRGVSDSLVNGLRYGLDNRIHAANGGSGGTLRAAKRPDETVRLGDDDFAFHPDTGVLGRTGETGGGFGLVFDDFGRAFTTYNIDHVQHRFLSRAQAERFPGFPPRKLTGSISDHGEMSRIFPISTAVTRPNHPEQAGHFSAAGGMGIVGSDAFPEELRGSVFVCDVVGNLVHRDWIVPDGPVFRASRPASEQTNEFLASRDGAFRPVGLETGPDGALYLLDMQRDVIEHPDYIPAKLRAKQDIRAGEDRGRIYRLTPKGGLKPARGDLARLQDRRLVAELASGNQWRRLTAQRLLVERYAVAVVPELRQLATSSPRAVGRLHALWTLQGFDALTPAELHHALRDTHPGVRENALWLAAGFLTNEPALAEAVVASTRDPVARVRFVAAQVCGGLNSAAATAALAGLLVRDLNHEWTRRAVWSSLAPAQGRGLAAAALPSLIPAQGPAVEALRELAELFGARAALREEDVVWLVGQLPEPPGGAQIRVALLEGLAAGLERSGAKPALSAAANRKLEVLFTGGSPAELRAAWLVAAGLGLPENEAQRTALARAVQAAADTEREVPVRVEQIRLLGLGGAETVVGPLLALLDAREPQAIQQAALTELRRFKEPEVGSNLVARWRSLGPALRPAALNLLLERRQFHGALLAALESEALTVGELNLDLEQRRRLLRGGTPEIRERAAKFMGDEEYSNRKSVVDDWLARLPAQGDAVRGRRVFEEACARCHVSGGVGRRVGPDLTAMSHRSVEDLLSNILDPNMAINPGFVAYAVETKDGEAQTGLLESENSEAVTLVQADEQRLVIPRRNVVKLESSGRSLMPEGLEAGRSAGDLRDLIAFLQAEL